jgi:tuftelin-interacting protein 11
VACFAEEQGVEFVPRPGRMHEGQPVYSFGGISCVLDIGHQLVHALIRERWTPVSLEGMLQAVQAKR